MPTALTATGKAHQHAACVPTADGLDRAHPLVRTLFKEMRRQNVTYELLCRRAGVSFWTVRRWRRGQVPDLSSIEACLNVLGVRIVTRKRKD